LRAPLAKYRIDTFTNIKKYSGGDSNCYGREATEADTSSILSLRQL